MKKIPLIALILIITGSGCDNLNPPPAEPQVIIKRDTIEITVVQRDTVYVEKEDTTNQSPEIIVSSPTTQILYRQCQNKVTFRVPDLGDSYNPLIVASTGVVYQSVSDKRMATIVPSGKECKVTISQQSDSGVFVIGSIDYRVIEPPMASIRMIVNGKEYNGMAPVSKNARISFLIKPDPEFRAAMPKDATYSLRSIDVFAQLSLGPPVKVNSIRGTTNMAGKPISVPMGNKIRQAKPGTKVFIRLNEISRRNFEGRSFPDTRFKDTDRTFGFTIR